jgi:hypothetical protein
MCDMYGCVDESVEGKVDLVCDARQVDPPLGAILASTAPDLADQLMLMMLSMSMLSSSTYYIYLDLP